ncbi:Co2+/Mg2+ efflux protein ApaG [Parendozoicomonas haliclonae]|uniref:Protein ApaG n=1 Tax=Parendozoicomonas haliclonae TaxID=1960125 RepID=A0A1X7AFB3_9GAMM|nr:Co2+/Mg2+ efflux protein ApaG [Parendozoicomonas haliclonae]SMA35383.1 CO2+/MG2+ efflux protein ApaG [Parendozoicomonas haliclonae]
MLYRCPIEVTVETEYLSAQSQPDKQQFAFAYHITIHNRGQIGAQLLSRHWFIINGDHQQEEVQGEGVVGQQPHISPGSSYSYTSGCILATPVGCMTGSYRMVNDEGEEFETPIPLFSLQVPGVVN